MTKTVMPATAERFLVSINLRSMEVRTEDGRDAYLRAVDGPLQVDSFNSVYVNGTRCFISNYKLYGSLLLFLATPIAGGSNNG